MTSTTLGIVQDNGGYLWATTNAMRRVRERREGVTKVVFELAPRRHYERAFY